MRAATRRTIEGWSRAVDRARLLTVAGDLSAVGGAEIAQLRVMEGLSSKGWAIELLYARRGDLWPRWNELATRTQAIHSPGLQGTAPFRSGLGVLRTAVDILRSHVQIVYAHNPGDLPSALLAARARRIPVAVHLHLPPPFRQPGWMNRLIRQADAVIIPSSDAANRWIRVAGLSNDRVSVIPTGIEAAFFRPLCDDDRAEQRKALGLDPEVPMILYAGRVDATKGVAHLLHAFRCMSQRANLVICGAGADVAFVDELRRESSDQAITWLDRRLHVMPLLAAADLVAVPSVVFETQGMVAIEAMSCGTPVVASAVGGLPETLAAFPDHLVPPGDSIALAGALDRLVGWREHSPTLGDDSRRWTVDHLTLDHTVSAVSALLSSLLR